jgi:DNA-binding CsgD family transcriptional regulator
MLRSGRIGTAVAATSRAADLVASAAPADPQVEARSAVALGAALAAAGDVAAGRPLLDRHVDVVALEGWVAAAPFLADTVVLARIRLGDHEAARHMLERLATEIGRASAPHAVPGVLAMEGFLAYRAGQLTDAAVAASAAVQLADETCQPGLVAFPLGTLATVEALRGDEASCRAAAGRLADLSRHQEGGAGHDVVARSALGLLELGLGRPDRALVELEPLAALLDRARPSVLMWEADLADALIRSGRTQDAEPVIANLEEAATRAGDARAAAAVARLRALVAPEDERSVASGHAIAAYRELGLRFGLARSLLDHGGWLRRTRRRKAARAPLDEAMAIFEAMGATSWATMAATELDRCGAGPRPPATPVDQLTPQERQVARLVADGASNREVSARLFISVRTVESHLGRIYRKLGLRSRSELSRWATGRGFGPAEGAPPTDRR